MKRTALFLLVLLSVAAVRADVIYLHHGGRLSGRIERETEDDVTIRLELGSMTVLRAHIREIVRGATSSPEPGPAQRPIPAGDGAGMSRRNEPPAPGAVPLGEAISRGLVTVEAWGHSIQHVRLVLERCSPEATTIYILPGTMFGAPPYSDSHGDMVSVSGVNVTLLEAGEVEVLVPVSSVDIHERTPTAHQLLRFGATRPSPELTRLVSTLIAEPADAHAQQAAVWIVTNDPAYGDMSSLPFPDGALALRASEAVRGMQLCEKAGIDLDTKRIGQDDSLLLGALSDVELRGDDPTRAFAMERLRKLGFHGRTEGELVADVLALGEGRELLVVACDVAAKGRYREAVGPLKKLLEECTAKGPLPGGLVERARSDLVNLDREAVASRAANAIAAISGVPRSDPEGPRPGSAEAVVEECLAALGKHGAGDEYRALRVLENLAPQKMSAALRRRVADDLIAFLLRTGGRHGDQLGRALARYHDVLIPRDLETLTNAESPVARRVAARTLGRIERLTATEALVRLLQDEDADARRAAADGLKGRQDAAKVLADLNLHPIPEVRALAMDLLLELEGFYAERSLRDAVLNARGDRQKRMIARLGELESELSSFCLARLLQKNGDPEVRRLAAEALGRIGGRVARTALSSMESSEGDRRVRREIELALRAIGSE